MQAIVKNFRGIIEAHIDISPIALIAGLNGAGKTSIARAVAAAATGKPIPYDKVTKKDCAILLRHGTKAAMAVIGSNNPEGSTQVEWPKAEAHSTGTPPAASDIAVGITDLFSMKPDVALAYMIDLLKAAPTLEDLQAEFITPDMALEDTKKWQITALAIWDAIEKKGWDGAYKQASETGTRLKGAWQQVAGTNYGSKKAAEWYPEGWDDILLQHTPESLAKAIADAQQALETAIGKSAVSRAEQEKLQALVDQLPEFEKLVIERQAAVAAAAAALKEIEDKLKNTPNPSAKVDYSCPHCEGPIHITAVSGSEFRLTKAEKVDENHVKEARKIHAGLCGEQQNISNAHHESERALQDAIFKRNGALQAQEKLKGIDTKDTPDGDPVAAARGDLTKMQNIRQMVEKYHEARKVSGQIASNQIIIDALDETGLRKKKLAQCLDAFAESYLTPRCADLDISPLLIDADLSVQMGEVRYQMLSASEQFRVRAVLQMGIAMLERSALVIIDGTDILDKRGRTRLLNMVMNAKMPAIICMTLNKPDMAPNLALAGVGMTYWVEDGNCRRMSETGTSERAAA